VKDGLAADKGSSARLLLLDGTVIRAHGPRYYYCSSSSIAYVQSCSNVVVSPAVICFNTYQLDHLEAIRCTGVPANLVL
jgi:hypothetical protein